MTSFLNKIAAVMAVVILVLPASGLAIGSSDFKVEILGLCGNGIKEVGEQCDDQDFSGASCITRGYGGGTLSCTAGCVYNTGSCTPAIPSNPPTGGGGGGGGGGSTVTTPSVTTSSVVFIGRSYPLNKVYILKDGVLATTTVAGPDAKFTVTLSGLNSGNYNFSVYGEDKNGIRSAAFAFPVYLTANSTAQVSGIFIAPTIKVDKDRVMRGETVAIFGQSTPNATIEIVIHSDDEIVAKTPADANGVYLYNLDTQVMDLGEHSARSKSLVGNEISVMSDEVAFSIGDGKVEPKPEPAGKGDLSGDGKVNLVDFSVAAYWYKRPSPSPKADLNSDGKVDLVDFSILAYYWTG